MAGTKSGPSAVDVVIVGNGPSALILSYILHGNIPVYNRQKPHPDPILHEKLKNTHSLLDLDIDRLTEHFEASRFSYSTQALPVNSLLDALVRPNADTDDAEQNTCIEWRYEADKVIPHVVLGNAPCSGGQWTECPKGTTWDIQSLSYAGMFSLPGYSFQTYHQERFGSPIPPFTRPSRREIAGYFAAYPAAVGISDAIKSGETVRDVSRTGQGFYIGSHNLTCKSLVLASGIFTELKPARPLLQPLLQLPAPNSGPTSSRAPLLVIGSGFSAADIIISAPRDQKIIHIFKWDPENGPSPLKNCHQQAYPEYAGVYRLMKRSASRDSSDPHGVWFRPSSLTPFLRSRQWKEVYEGLPNTIVTGVETNVDGAVVTLQLRDGTTLQRQVSGLEYAVGRQGSLRYLDEPLRREILGNEDRNSVSTGLISASTLRDAAVADLEVAKNVFIIGSLAGDSLIRFAYGGCVYVAGKLSQSLKQGSGMAASDSRPQHGNSRTDELKNGLEGHNNIRAGERHDDHAQERSSDSWILQLPVFMWAKGKSWWNFLFS